MRSKPRKQRNKIKHIGGAEEAPHVEVKVDEKCIEAMKQKFKTTIIESRRDTLENELKADCTARSGGVCILEDNKCVPILKTNNN